MAVNGIRVSSLPEMDVADLTKDDFLIVNDGNTNTKRINFEKFLGAVDQNITEITNNVTSVNTLTGEVTITAIGLGAATTAELKAVEDKIIATDEVVLKNTGDISNNATDITSNSTAIGTNRTDIDTNAAAISANAGGISTNVTNIATNAGGISTNAIAIANEETRAKAAEQANAAAIVTNADAIATNETDIATNAGGISTNATAIANLENGTTDLVGPSVNGSEVTATGDELSQLAGVTLGTAAQKAEGDFATAAQGVLAGTALQPADLDDYSTTAEATAEAAALYAPISVTGAEGVAAKTVTDAITSLTSLADADDTVLTTPAQIATALQLIIDKVNAITGS